MENTFFMRNCVGKYFEGKEQDGDIERTREKGERMRD
jgi:hypothetical protein